MEHKRDIAIESTSMLVDNIVTRVVAQLNTGNSFGGFGCILKTQNELVPLQFAQEGEEATITPEFYNRILQALKDGIAANRAVTTGIASEGSVSLDGKQHDAVIIIMFHEVLQHETITYVIPYTKEASQEVVLLDDAAVLEFNEM